MQAQFLHNHGHSLRDRLCSVTIHVEITLSCDGLCRNVMQTVDFRLEISPIIRCRKRLSTFSNLHFQIKINLHTDSASDSRLNIYASTSRLSTSTIV